MNVPWRSAVMKWQKTKNSAGNLNPTKCIKNLAPLLGDVNQTTKTIVQSEFILVHSTVSSLLVLSFPTSTLEGDDNRKYLFTIPTRPQMQFRFNNNTRNNGRLESIST